MVAVNAYKLQSGLHTSGKDIFRESAKSSVLTNYGQKLKFCLFPFSPLSLEKKYFLLILAKKKKITRKFEK